VDESGDTFDRVGDSCSLTQTMVLNHKMMSPWSILEESKDERAKLKSEGMRNYQPSMNLGPPIDYSNFQVVSVKGTIQKS